MFLSRQDGTRLMTMERTPREWSQNTAGMVTEHRGNGQRTPRELSQNTAGMVTEHVVQQLIQKHINFAPNLGHEKFTLKLGTS
jgi:hypothetical protein